MLLVDVHQDEKNNIYLGNQHSVDTIMRMEYTKNNGVSRAQAEKKLQGQLNGQKIVKLKTVGETEIVLSHKTLIKLAELTKEEETHED